MKKIYVQSSIKVVNVPYKGVLCASGNIETESKTKKYGCPIKKGVACPAYDKVMNDYVRWVKHLAETNSDTTFFQCSDAYSCPRKSCPIYLEWKQKKR